MSNLLKSMAITFAMYSKGELLKEHTTFRVGGVCKFFLTPVTEEELRLCMEIIKKENMKYCLLFLPVVGIVEGIFLIVFSVFFYKFIYLFVFYIHKFMEILNFTFSLK